jgi:hypothetical protein
MALKPIRNFRHEVIALLPASLASASGWFESA